MKHTPSILILTNPGRTSMHYMRGVAAGAAQLGLRHQLLDLGEAWAAQKAGASAHVAFNARLTERLGEWRVTHCLGYSHNATTLVTKGSTGAPAPLLTNLGIASIMLWTDHPEWCVGGSCLDEPMRSVLSHPLHTHVLKSKAAATEAASVLGWPGIVGMPMGEDVERLMTLRRIETRFDASMVVSDAAAPSEIAARFLDDDDPRPEALDLAHAPGAINAVRKTLSFRPEGLARFEAATPMFEAWLSLKRSQPTRSFHALASGLDASHTPHLAWLRTDPRLWYGTIVAMRTMTGWRRNFWPAWLARRVRLGVFGCDASCWGVEQEPSQRAWVDYDRLGDAYGSGRCAVSVNAAHDEEGVTHKPFQIACCRRAMIHHETSELDHLFTPGSECLIFRDGPTLLEHVRACADESKAATIAERALDRCHRDHGWHERLRAMLAI